MVAGPGLITCMPHVGVKGCGYMCRELRGSGEAYKGAGARAETVYHQVLPHW